LGGGSSNAASTICALNKMWDLRLSLNEMMLIGLDLGADVPLFIKGENAYAGGVGEKLVEKKPIDEKLIIISPDILNSTEEMFNLYDIQEGPTELFSQQNSFWKVFVEKNEEIKEFYEQYAKKFEICLSGTGSSMFIKYNNNSEKQKILKIIPSNWRFFLAKPLQYSPLKSLDSNGV
jgi:4-diphosphocytidyl-2-C-methyl-D-erythritol kinase